MALVPAADPVVAEVDMGSYSQCLPLSSKLPLSSMTLLLHCLSYYRPSPFPFLLVSILIICHIRWLIDKAERLIGDAATYGAQQVVFPEAFIGGYPRGSNFGVAIGTVADQQRERGVSKISCISH
ncbi:hypothetical protein AMTR_s00018p00086690 [Amborella trichopoda]|uniref:CN hydrolase domain-containing protein n=1 Tax=Amborella trichopoda TaxID=13333 RepID=W1PKE6_AMBTC|nr:hypothetical protein AMTR_s00018p00086690 [Amborella trichopoda]